ncbi:hypothetical protein JS84_20540 [Vibrio vulnificus]|nr:hypothetical protein Y702_20430 [Vibrio vulnificus BAA87]KFK59466.1 hypothetical protein JS83_13150 [Vibrio vulnificus]KFK62692.1 hypothetical protein JS84_20540 [Vibrio vulnificus]KFK67874.1 hypothetical protein JS85_17620 [Vibrio vulnificus]POC53919.1 hypothetical protein CRN45_04315 [Vibrio vulnificus]
MFGIQDLKEAVEEVIAPQMVERMDSKMVAVKAVTINAKDEAKGKNDEVTVDFPINFADAEDMDDARNGVNSDIEMKQEKVKLAYYIHKQFTLKETELLATRESFILTEAQLGQIDAVVRRIEKDLYNEIYRNTRFYAGDLASANTRDKTDIVQVRKALKKHGLVEDGRKLLMHEDTEADLMVNMNPGAASGDEQLMREGSLGRRFGFDLYAGTYAPIHEAGTASENAGLKVKVAATKGATEITLTSLNAEETVVDGDLVEFADGQTYTVKGNFTATGADLTITLRQALDADVAADVAVDIKESHNVDLALHASTAVIAFRPLEESDDGNSFSVNITHADTGIPLTIRYFTEKGGRVRTWAVECLYGIKHFDLGRSVRMGGH